MKHKKTKGFFRAHKLICLVFLIFIYLITGATVPFMRFPELRPETVGDFEASAFRKGTPGVDRAALLETNESAWEERIRLMARARERIVLSTFDMRPGESTMDILAMLLNRADKGVQVRILVDGFSGAVRMEGRSLFYALSSHPNVEIRIYNPMNLLFPWKLEGRMHDKYVIVDDEAYILGGRNTFDYFIGTYTDKNVSRDREVLIYNTKPGSPETSLCELEAYFEQVWNLEVCRPFHNNEDLAKKESVKEQRALLEERYEQLAKKAPKLFDPEWDYEQHTYEAGSIRLISNPTGIYAKEPVVFYKLVQLMKEAGERVVIQSPYVVLNSYMCQELTMLKETVPDVKILLNSVENGDNFVASSDYLRNKDRILDTGIPLYEYDGGISNHAKSILIDSDLSVIGSYNLDLRSSYLDTELMLVVESRELNRELEGYMKEMETDSRRVLPDGNYEVPEHITVEEVPYWKRAAWGVVGFLLQPFRMLI
ncbi:MAG: phospholipase D family protein [Lachnospiraceae bacterium]|nr:phospholipase D family protein [Lachnospiraceae bacterium]